MFDSLLLTLVMIMDDHEGVAEGDGGHDEDEDSDGEHNPYEVCYKINSRIANVVHVTCHTHVPCHMSHVTLTGC